MAFKDVQTRRLGQHIDVLIPDAEVHANSGAAGEIANSIDRRQHRDRFLLGIRARGIIKLFLDFTLQAHLSSLDELRDFAVRNIRWRKIQSVANIRSGDTSQIPSEFTYPIDKKVL